MNKNLDTFKLLKYVFTRRFIISTGINSVTQHNCIKYSNTLISVNTSSERFASYVHNAKTTFFIYVFINHSIFCIFFLLLSCTNSAHLIRSFLLEEIKCIFTNKKQR